MASTRALQLQLERFIVPQRFFRQHHECLAGGLADGGLDLPLLDARTRDTEDFLLGGQADFDLAARSR